MTPRLEVEAFGADGRRDDRFGHRQRLENLQPRAAAGAQRHDVHRAFGNRRTHVVERAGDKNARTLGELANARGGIAADDRERHVRHLGANAREDRLDEMEHGVFVRMPVH